MSKLTTLLRNTLTQSNEVVGGHSTSICADNTITTNGSYIESSVGPSLVPFSSPKRLHEGNARHVRSM